MPFLDRLVLCAAAAVWLGSAGPSWSVPPEPGARSDEEDDVPTPAPLTVGSLAIASNASLVVRSMAVDVAADKVVYAYAFQNKGTAKLALAASVALPDLEVNNEGNSNYELPAGVAENPVGLAVSSDGRPIATRAHVQAVALGIDRLAELRAAQMPLIPFGADIDRALASAKPDTMAALEGLGLVTPRDPTQPDTPAIADWSLRVVHDWTIEIEPAATRKVSVGFAPVKAVYKIDAPGLAGFDALKDQVCLTPEIVGAAKALLRPKGATVDVADITLANDGPARWLDNPPATVAVRKPKPNAVVAFCGLDATTAGQMVVTGKMPGSGEAAGLRVLIFSSAVP